MSEISSQLCKDVTQKSILGGRIFSYVGTRYQPNEVNDCFSNDLLEIEKDFNNKYVYNNDLFVSNPSLTIDNQIKPRKISSNPYRILDAPGLSDDFYLNLVDWSS